MTARQTVHPVQASLARPFLCSLGPKEIGQPIQSNIPKRLTRSPSRRIP